MAYEPVNRIQYPYLSTLDLTTSEHLKIYNKEIVGLPESNMYDLTKSKWNKFYQELEDSVFIFGFKASVLIVAAIYLNQAPTEFNNSILFYPSIIEAMVDSHCENLWNNNSGAGLGHHPTTPQHIMEQQRMFLTISKSLINGALGTRC